ncbi:hypothetical protein CAEBREN_18738 [Caenorhabditis brenneri]|uniref:Uncharacterized protein n=1 Tax=Caenorhabditis brenneri TaxID=135651 RepID=G0P2U2_CAEBE|nr:hypothetical protein CAEBREN_18738 [Caenorhabditis brenneri]
MERICIILEEKAAGVKIKVRTLLARSECIATLKSSKNTAGRSDTIVGSDLRIDSRCSENYLSKYFYKINNVKTLRTTFSCSNGTLKVINLRIPLVVWDLSTEHHINGEGCSISASHAVPEFGRWKANSHSRSEIGDIIEELKATYPPSVIPAPTNHAVVSASAVTPQKVPTEPTINVQQTIQPTVVPIVNSKHAKEQKAKAERLRVAGFKEKAAPSVHEMPSRNQYVFHIEILQEKFNNFCKKFGVTVDNYKIPSKTIIQQWKNNAFVGINEPLFVTLFEKHLIECGFRHELALYQQIEDFKKQRNKVYRKLRAQQMFDGFMDDKAAQKSVF